jgi:hypothetical protein
MSNGSSGRAAHRANRSSRAAPSTEFPEGYGDFIFKSSDNIVFHFPHFLLSHASPVFSDMFQLGRDVQNQRMLTLPEDHKTLEHLLCHIDSAKTTPKLDWECTPKVLAAAEKYQINNIFSWFEREVSLEALSRSPPSLVHPFTCLCLADKYNLQEIGRLALRQLVMYPIDKLTFPGYVNAELLRHLYSLREARTLWLTEVIADLEDTTGLEVSCPDHLAKPRSWARAATREVIREPSWKTLLLAFAMNAPRCKCNDSPRWSYWLKKAPKIEAELPPWLQPKPSTS